MTTYWFNPFCPGVAALGQAPRPHDQLWHHPPMPDKQSGGAHGHGPQGLQAAEAAQGQASVTASPRSRFIRAQRDAAIDAYDQRVITDRDRRWLLYVYDHMEAYP